MAIGGNPARPRTHYMYQPQSDLESALIATLPPGLSTGIVAGKGGAIGVALVEVYHLR